MATRPPDHPALEPAISQPGAISVQSDTRFPFTSDTPGPERGDTPAQSEAADTFLRLALDRWQTIDSSESVLRAKMREDLRFFASDQWPTKILNQRNQDGRPCLTVNRQPGFVRQITNEMRDAKPGIEVIPVDNGADVDLAEAIQGLLQHVEANSDADVAYARATEGQVRVGRGYFRIVPEYASDTGFEQELRIKSIRNQATVYFDAASQELDGSDARYAFIVDDIPIPDYDAKYGEASRSGLTQWARVGELRTNWMPEGKIRIAEYYCLIPKKRWVAELRNGMVVEKAQLADPQVQQMLLANQIDPTPVREREVDGRQLTWALINGCQILEGNATKTGGRELPGRWIPIFPVYGEEIDLDGQVDYRGIIRDSIDAQRMTNFWKSSMTETVALAPRTPFIAAQGQLEGHEAEWQQANVKNFSVLQYKPIDVGGQMAPPPQRQTAEPPIQAMAMLTMQAENDLRATAGFLSDVGANEHRPEQSGKAILARQRQGEVGNAHFSAHLAISLRHAGRVLLDLIPSYYDTPRVKRILGRDGQFRQVILHSGNPDEAKALQAQQNLAEARIFDLSVGRYDVRIVAGASYASQRQQDQELLVNALQTNPQLMPLIGDLFFLTLDSPIARRISQRLEKALPPGLKDTPEGQQPPIPPEIQQQMQQAGQLVEALTQQLNQKTQELDDKREELASKERIAQIQAETAMTIEQAKIASAQQLAQIQAESDTRLASLKVTADHSLAEMKNQSATELFQSKTQHESTLAGQQRQAESDRTSQQLASAESQTEAKLGAEQAMALLEARMQHIEQQFGIDMARFQADHESDMLTQQARATTPPSATAPD
jgi:hypothetical protein